MSRLSPVKNGMAGAAALVFSLPFGVLVVQAFADSWRAPELWPQRFGLRGWRVVASGATGALPAIGNSLLVASASVVVALVVGWPAARALGGGRLRRPGPVFILLALPLLVPPFAVGTGLSEWFIRFGVADTRLGLVLAHLVYVLPYVVLLLAPGFGENVTKLEEAASAMGAGRARKLVHVTIPALGPALAASALLGFLVSWGQYGTSLAVGGGLSTLPLVLVPFVQTDPQVAAALGVLYIAPAIVALVVATRHGRQLR